MVAARKRYQSVIEDRDDGPPITTAPPAARVTPAAEDAPKPAEPVAIECEAELAAKNVMRERVAEMERAADMQREAIVHQQRLATEAQQAPQIPAHVQKWLAARAAARDDARASRWPHLERW